jgi:hypothetical protein
VDTLLSPVLLGVRDCLCEQLRSSVAGPVCQCYVVHNQALPTMDGCDCTCVERELDALHAGRGEATVRVVRLEPDVTTLIGPGPCAVGWQAVISMVTYRCVPTAEGDDVLPPEVRTSSALELNSDLTAMLSVLACCDELTERDRSVDWAGPIGPIGGCGGWETQFRVTLPGGPGRCD